MKWIVFILLFATPAWAADPLCTEQDYSNPDKRPDWRCPGPDESVLLPDIKFKPSVGLETGASYQETDQTRKIKLTYPVVLMDKDKVLQLGLRIQGLRRLRWLDLHKGKDLLKIEKTYTTDRLKAQVDLEKSRVKVLKEQRDDARKQRDEARKWYRSWTCGLVVGIVVTTAAAAGIAYAASR
jgi:hypothetical protein